MANFEVKIYKLNIKEHPNADTIELAQICDYQSIVRKGQYVNGDLCAYIPEGSIVPEKLLSFLGLDGKLAGKDKNRVSAVKLRGEISQGLIVPVKLNTMVHGDTTPYVSDVYVLSIDNTGAGLVVEEGKDVTEWLGITKYEPQIPIHMAGEVFNSHGNTLKYDVENIKKFPEIFTPGEDIVIHEKLHGTWCCMGMHPSVPHAIITSKGLSKDGLAFKLNEANANNLYITAYKSTMNIDGSDSAIERVAKSLNISLTDTPLYLLGEVFGASVQDLAYGLTRPTFRLFDIFVGEPTTGKYLNPLEMQSIADIAGILTVPTLYVGKYSKSIVDEYTNGTETISGKGTHIREGIVIRPQKGRSIPGLGRVFLKSVSEDYLLRKGKTSEFS